MILRHSPRPGIFQRARRLGTCGGSNAFIASRCCIDNLDVRDRLRGRLLVTFNYTVTGAGALAGGGALAGAALAGPERVVILGRDRCGRVYAREQSLRA
jgi:hypothetical protein